MPTKKPTPKAAPKKVATFKPVAEATPRYAPPVVEVAPIVAVSPTVADESLELTARFWWAFTWRSLVVTVPVNLLLQFIVIVWHGEPEGADDTLGLTMLGLMLAVNVLVQVAVLRSMLLKKHFKGFTFTLTRR